MQIPDNCPFEFIHNAISKISGLISIQEENATKVEKMKERVEKNIEKKEASEQE